MWARIVSVLLGVWLMTAPAALAYAGPARTNDRIAGPLIASFAYIALWEITRGLRWLNLPLGAWLVLAPWILGYDAAPTLNSILVGLAVIGLSFVRGPTRHHYGGGWRSLLDDDERHTERATR